VAVADGASESLLAGRWARLLAAAACRYDPRALRLAVRWAATRWPEETARWLGDRDPPWWMREKLDRGAHATVVTAQVHRDGQWRAAAVGDSCLLHVSDGRLKRAFPLDTPAAFTDRPDLVSSTRPGACRPRHASGVWQPHDHLLLVTDALAMWLLGAPDLIAGLLAAVASGGAAAFAEQAERARREGALRNDDLTLLVLDRDRRRR
jgi:hypothetical protein